MEFEQQTVCNVYNKIAERFNQTRGYGWSWIKSFVESLPENSLVYDIGCGSGRNMLYPNHKFIGVDNCDNFLNICTMKGLNVIKSDMCSLPFLNNSADALMVIASFHHLSTETRRIAALKEFTRVIKDNGKILLSVWSIQQPKKTRRTFDKYGDTIVPWDQFGEIHNRYYYIFQIENIKILFNKCGLTIDSHTWDCGNEVFILSKNVSNLK